MGALVERLWARLKNEPVAGRLTPVLLGAAAYLVWKDGGDPTDIIAALVVAIGGGGAVVAARAKVWPESKLPTDLLAKLRQALSPDRPIE